MLLLRRASTSSSRGVGLSQEDRHRRLLDQRTHSHCGRIQPSVPGIRLQHHDHSLILRFQGEFGVWLMHPAHQGGMGRVKREHRVALGDFTGGLIHPGVPQPRQPKGIAINSLESPPDIPTCFTARLPENGYRNNAALLSSPRLAKAGLGLEFLGTGIVGATGEVG